MRRLLAVLLFTASLAVAADDPQKQIEAMQAGLAHSRAQTSECNFGQIQMAAEIAALRKELEALKKKDAPPK